MQTHISSYTTFSRLYMSIIRKRTLDRVVGSEIKSGSITIELIN